jgi:hypothetical protein
LRPRVKRRQRDETRLIDEPLLFAREVSTIDASMTGADQCVARTQEPGRLELSDRRSAAEGITRLKKTLASKAARTSST